MQYIFILLYYSLLLVFLDWLLWLILFYVSTKSYFHNHSSKCWGRKTFLIFIGLENICKMLITFQMKQLIIESFGLLENQINSKPHLLNPTLFFVQWLTMHIELWGLAEKFIGWPRYSHWMWQSEIYFSTSPPCGSCTSSISVAVLGSHWSKKKYFIK